MSTKFTGSIAQDLGWGIAVAAAVGSVSGIIWFGSMLLSTADFWG